MPLLSGAADRASWRLRVLAPHILQGGPGLSQAVTGGGVQTGHALEGPPGYFQPGPVMVVGGAVVDIQAHPGPADLLRGGSVPGRVRHAAGGVGRNIAEGLSRLLQAPLPPPLLVSLIGDDAGGAFLLAQLQSLRLDLSLLVRRPGMTTPCVAVIFDRAGEVAACVADVESLEQHFVPSLVSELLAASTCSSRGCRSGLGSGSGSVLDSQASSSSWAGNSRAGTDGSCCSIYAADPPVLVSSSSSPSGDSCGCSSCRGSTPEAARCSNSNSSNSQKSAGLTVHHALWAGPALRPSMLVIEANLSVDSILAACEWAAASRLPVLMEPVSVPKSVRCLPALPYLSYIKPNAAELVAMADCLTREQGRPDLPRPRPDGTEHSRPDLAAGTLRPAASSGTLGPGEAAGAARDDPRGVSHAPHCLVQLVPFAAVVLQAALISDDADDPEAGQHRTGRGEAGRGLRVRVSFMRAPTVGVVSLSGAGDALVAGLVAGLVRCFPAVEALAYGMAAAGRAIQSDVNVPEDLSFDGLAWGARQALTTLWQGAVTVQGG